MDDNGARRGEAKGDSGQADVGWRGRDCERGRGREGEATKCERERQHSEGRTARGLGDRLVRNEVGKVRVDESALGWVAGAVRQTCNGRRQTQAQDVPEMRFAVS